MDFQKVADLDALKPGDKKSFPLSGKTILLAKVDGTIYALDNKCPHLGGSLSDGELVDVTLTCPRHGAKFDVRTGKNVGNAKLAFIQMKVADAKSYPVKVEGNDILVALV